MDEVEITRNGRSDQFSVTRAGSDTRSDGEKHRAALSKAKMLAKALDTAIESS